MTIDANTTCSGNAHESKIKNVLFLKEILIIKQAISHFTNHISNYQVHSIHHSGCEESIQYRYVVEILDIKNQINIG